jgi:hypothetical protein
MSLFRGRSRDESRARLLTSSSGAGRGGRTPMTLRSADFESAASASSAIPARGGIPFSKYRTALGAQGVPRGGKLTFRESEQLCAEIVPHFTLKWRYSAVPLSTPQVVAPKGDSRATMEATAMTTASSAVVPEPVSVTPQLLAQHSITADEYSRILAALGPRAFADRVGHLQRDVERALLLQVQPRPPEAPAHQE